MLIILQELMYRAYVEAEGRAPKREEIPKPCDYFDLIAGTGTGGLIAIMLGRLRLSIETCMEVYVRMTRRVFETDKTIAGIPYKSTLFKASKLEDAIKECVREHTIFEDEGNDGTPTGGREFQGFSPANAVSSVQRTASVRSTNSADIHSPLSQRNSLLGNVGLKWGNANASLYDDRLNRTKTAVTAVFKGTPKSGSSIFLRSYESRREPPPEFNCSIWQAGRATSATGLAFKPIQIGQSVFVDEGAGKYNPSPQVLDEAAVNEYPGRDVGVFVSIGTGKRPGGSKGREHEWYEGFIGGSVGAFAEARRRLIAKIEGCEDTHIEMLNAHLAKRGVPLENYCRLNVEVGVGEFGMNEWDRLADISTGTRQYLQRQEVQKLVYDAAVKMAKIERMKRRLEAHERAHQRHSSGGQQNMTGPLPAPPMMQEPSNPSHPFAVELPADDGMIYSRHNTGLSQHQQRHPSNPNPNPYSYSNPPPASQQPQNEDKFILPPDHGVQRVSAELPYRNSYDKTRPSNQNQSQSNYNHSPPSTASPRQSGEENMSYTSGVSADYQLPAQAPPRPPKTPINEMSPNSQRPPRQNPPRLPYPDDDGPPPLVSKLRKPEFRAG